MLSACSVGIIGTWIPRLAGLDTLSLMDWWRSLQTSGQQLVTRCHALSMYDSTETRVPQEQSLQKCGKTCQKAVLGKSSKIARTPYRWCKHQLIFYKDALTMSTFGHYFLYSKSGASLKSPSPSFGYLCHRLIRNRGEKFTVRQEGVHQPTAWQIVVVSVSQTQEGMESHSAVPKLIVVVNSDGARAASAHFSAHLFSNLSHVEVDVCLSQIVEGIVDVGPQQRISL